MASAMNMVASNTGNFASATTSSTNAFFSKADQTALQEDDKISQHFSSMGKKSWEKRKNDLLNK